MNKKLELSTILGISLAFTLILVAILVGGSSTFLSFFDLPSFLIVAGGTFFVTCASFTIEDVVRAIKTCGQTTLYNAIDKREITANCVKLAELAKRSGMLAMQKASGLYDEMGEFFSRHLFLLIDGLNAKELEKLMVQEIISTRERHKKAVEIIRKAVDVAPAMGLIGTLIGLVQMLSNLNDPSKIGPAMAIALLTTLYGALIAYVILTPLASKLERNSRDEIDILKIYAEAIIAIANQEGPLRIEMRMNSNLKPEDRIKIFS